MDGTGREDEAGLGQGWGRGRSAPVAQKTWSGTATRRRKVYPNEESASRPEPTAPATYPARRAQARVLRSASLFARR